MAFYNKETQNVLRKIVQTNNVLIIFHPSEPSNKRYFIVKSFTPSQNQIFDHTLQGKEITEFIDSNYLASLFGISNDPSLTFLQKQTFDSKLEEIKDLKIKFSKDYSYEWWVNS